MPRATAAEQSATELLTELGSTTVPVGVEKIARDCGAQITYESFEGDISGMLLRDDDRVIIGVNSTHAPTRQRFTIAHEIGHLRMHPGRPVYVDRFVRVNLRDGQSTKEEREANAFAAELLMPRVKVLAEVDEAVSKNPHLTPMQLTTKLAELFDVSAAAMQYRLINLEQLDPYSLAG